MCRPSDLDFDVVVSWDGVQLLDKSMQLWEGRSLQQGLLHATTEIGVASHLPSTVA